jgi:hypothetical protein
MPLPLIANTVRAAVVGTTAGGGPWVNVWHFEYTTPPNTTNIDALHALFTRFYSGTAFSGGTPWLTACATSTTVSRVDYTVLDGAALGYTKTFAAAGGAGASTLPAEISPVLTLRTNTRGRRYRGRLYLPPPAAGAGQIDAAGHLLSSVATVVLAQAEGMRSALAAAGWHHVVASYGKSLHKDPSDPHDKIEVTWTPFATWVTTYTMDLVLDVQRRRKS